MDQVALVADRVEDGERLVLQLVHDNFDVTAAFWLKLSEESRWYLYIVSKLVDDKGLAAAYQDVLNSLDKLAEPRIDWSEIKLIEPTHPMARDVIKARKRYVGKVPTRYQGGQLGGMGIEEALIYPAVSKPAPVTMEGRATFFTFAYLRQAAASALESAKATRVGSGYQLVSAAVFASSAVEAHLNHVGHARFSFWPIVEPKLSWRGKLDLIAEQFGIKPDFDRRPFQTLAELFTFRDHVIHGKTHELKVSYQYREPGDDFDRMDPEWLSNYRSREVVERSVADAWKVMELIHEKAGFDKASLYVDASGEFAEGGSA
jgi:hypothetical protein